MRGYNRPGAPLKSYFLITVFYVALLALALITAWGMDIDFPRIFVLDMIIISIAVHKISWLIAGDVVTSFLRAPFTKFKEPMGPGAALHEQARGSGMQFALGELLTCPWCIGLWVAGVLVMGMIFVPDITRTVSVIFAVLAMADIMQVIYIKIGGDIVHYSDPGKKG